MNFVAGLARRAESSVASDWSLIPTVRNVVWRWWGLSDTRPAVRHFIDRTIPGKEHANVLKKSLLEIMKTLHVGTFTVRGKKRRINSDLSKLSQADNISLGELFIDN